MALAMVVGGDFYDADHCEMSTAKGRADRRADRANAECTAVREYSIADLIDAYADLGTAPKAIEQPRAAQRQCFEAFDRARGAERPESSSATESLANCIEGAARARRSDYVQQAVVNSRYTKSPAEIEAATTKAIDGAFESNRELCSTLADAGKSRDRRLAKAEAAMCRVHAAHNVYEIVNDAIARGRSEPTQTGIVPITDPCIPSNPAD